MWAFVLSLAAAGPALAGAALLMDVALCGARGALRRLRSGRAVALVTALSTPVAVGAGLLLGLAFEPSDAGILGAVFGVLSIGVPLLLTGHVLSGAVRGARARRLVRRLAAPSTRALELALLRMDLKKPRDGAHYGARLLRAIDSLTRAGLYGEVLSFLGSADGERVPVTTGALLRVYGALACIHHGDHAEARRWLGLVDVPLQGPLEAWRQVLDAVVSAVEGDPRRAGALVDEIDEAEYPLERAVARAHVLAAQGKTEEATAQLVRVRVELADEALESLELLSGPATPLAKELRRGARSPFR